MKKEKEIRGNRLFMVLLALLAVGVLFSPVRELSLIFFLGLAVLVFYRLVLKRARGRILVCGRCGAQRAVSTAKYLVTLHEMGSHYSECPECGYKEAFLKGNTGKDRDDSE